MFAHESDREAKVINSDTVKNAAMKVLVGAEEGWDNHVMRIIELDEEGYSPEHSHPWPHINYMIEGEGVLMMDGTDNPVKAGSFAYVPAGMHHQFKNAGKGKFRFICIVPSEGHK
ncbi:MULTISPECIES: cupin domain-containing protein [unclassified Fusibacter]|uniref:cupin domain-containing protein n=1 Tax=unclassified Fusibacter TaxID=2624464 RepID=UPI001012B458|nr:MULTISPECIES: cupin domain-containing protein [unclassified Fusibacter]MCK8059588.1 cupin domain-containing protein [Fusibacter sp. A2]NPE21389.1 cupin domain-containing protein [Fusibacter sp. A1]RXV61805.1 cupin domain-containing protein [Fusibacter sp. A1]